MKKPSLAVYHLKNRLEKLKSIKTLHGNEIAEMVSAGHTMGEIIKKIGCPKRTLTYYLESEGLLERCRSNWNNKRRELAKINGKRSVDVLAGIQLKPITTEIKNWFQEQLKLGKFKHEVRKELYDKFGFGEKKYYQLCNEVGDPPSRPRNGKFNSMYGKSPSKSSGNGVKGWVMVYGNKLFFRSSLELKIFLHLENHDIKFLPSHHRIKYSYQNSEKTYLPDIVIGNTIHEIKPSKLLMNDVVLVKFDALKKYCAKFNLNCGFITETTYSLTPLTKEYVDSLIEKKKLNLDEKNYNKLMRYI